MKDWNGATAQAVKIVRQGPHMTLARARRMVDVVEVNYPSEFGRLASKAIKSDTSLIFFSVNDTLSLGENGRAHVTKRRHGMGILSRADLAAINQVELRLELGLEINDRLRAMAEQQRRRRDAKFEAEHGGDVEP
jgi:hypothetical protein